jgi:hypothetical protein
MLTNDRDNVVVEEALILKGYVALQPLYLTMWESLMRIIGLKKTNFMFTLMQ